MDILVKVLRRASERGDDVADVDLLAHACLAGNRLQRAFEPSHHLARPLPVVAWRRKLANVRTLGLAAHRMMEAQIIGDLRHQGVEYGIAGEAEDVVGAVVLRPGGLVATVEINRELLAARQFVGTPICHLKCGLHATVAAKFSRLGEFSGLVSLLAPRRRIADQRPTQ